MKIPRILALLLSATVIGLLACGTSATETSPTGQSADSLSAQANNIASSENSVATSLESNSKVLPAVGTDVGKTLPQFEFTLSDGTKKSTAQLADQGKPVFLFFFATW